MRTPATEPPRSDARAAALARLEASRAHLRAALVPTDAPSHDAPMQAPARLLRHALRRWWRHQPWAAALRVGGAELRNAIVPVLRQHPLTSLAAAAALGAALVLTRQALWRLIAGQARPLTGSVGTWMWQQASSPAVQAALLAWLAQPARGGAAATDTVADAAVAAPPATDTTSPDTRVGDASMAEVAPTASDDPR